VGIVLAAIRVNAAGHGLTANEALSVRQKALKETDERGILATPANSYINELVTQAARLSIAREGQPAVIDHEPAPMVRLRAY
jgi:hypothetical protein